MIQRIQSLYLLLVFIGCAVLFFVPVASFKNYEMFIYGIREIGGTTIVPGMAKFIPLCILGALIGLLALFILFKYKNRRLQIKLVRLNILLNTIFVAAIFFYYTESIAFELLAKTIYTKFALIPFITLLLLILCIGAIYKDENLVKSADRLR